MAASSSPTVQDVETGARNLHPAFDTRTASPKLIREHLHRKATDLLELAIGEHPDPYLTCEFEYELPPADFESGEEIPEALYRRAGWVDLTGNRRSRLHLVTEADLRSPPGAFWPCATVLGGRVYLGGTEARWQGGLRATIRYAPPIGALAGPDSTFDPLPSYAESALVAEGALFLARRAALPLAEWLGERNDAVRAFLMTSSGLKRAVKRRVREVR